MKKTLIISILLSVLLFAGCSEGNNSSEEKQSSKVQETTIEHTTESLTSAELTTEIVSMTTPAAEPETEKITSSEISENSNESDYTNYLGTWTSVDTYGQGFTVTFSSINGTSVELYMCKVAPNAAHIAMTDKISTEIKNDKVYFELTDSFSNSGNGVLTLNGDTINLSTEATGKSQPFIYTFMGNAELNKTSDSTKIPY